MCSVTSVFNLLVDLKFVLGLASHQNLVNEYSYFLVDLSQGEALGTVDQKVVVDIVVYLTFVDVRLTRFLIHATFLIFVVPLVQNTILSPDFVLFKLVTDISVQMQLRKINLVLDRVQHFTSPLHSFHLFADLHLKRLVRVSVFENIRS